MEKRVKARNCKRESNLGTTETILKVLTKIYYAKKAGTKYSISQICREEHLGSINNRLVEQLYDWSYPPTIEQAEDIRQRLREYQKQHWKYYARPKTESDTAPMLEFDEVKESKQCNDFGVLEWNGHRYRLVPID
jgi:hypothetical protein